MKKGLVRSTVPFGGPRAGPRSHRRFVATAAPHGRFTFLLRFGETVVRIPLIVDANEPEDIQEKLRALGVDFEVKKIAPGDYVLGPVGIERKSLSDFFSSLVKKRLFEQVQRLRDAYPQPLVILEGDLAEISTFRHPQSILGALLALETTERVPVLTTADKDQTALLLSVLWKKQDKAAAEYGLRHKPKGLTLEQRQRFILEGLPSVGETLARNLLEHFGSVYAVFTASEEELKKVAKIGDGKAAEIVRLVGARYEGGQTRIDDEEGEDEDDPPL